MIAASLPTEDVWIFDARSNVPGITKKDRPLSPQNFAELEQCYGPDLNATGGRGYRRAETDRFRRFHATERSYKLDNT